MPSDASDASGLTISGNRSPSSPLGFSPTRYERNPGTLMPWNASTFLLIDLLRVTSSASGGAPV
jgi:hypothetical protein